MASSIAVSRIQPATRGRREIASGHRTDAALEEYDHELPTIVARKGATGPSFQARVRLTRDEELIHEESKTFSTKTPKAWAQNGKSS